MTYLVDGNNVIGQRVGWHRDKAGARRRLIDELGRFAALIDEPVAVVFDGAPDEAYPDGTSEAGVQVFYADPGADADTRIERLVERWREGHGLKVVTSDRRLADQVHRLGAAVIRSGELRRRLDALVDRG